MFEHYLKLVGDNGRVIISISQPTKAGSMRKGDGIDVISAEKAKEIIDIVLKDLNIGNGRITTQVSKNPSPVSDAWDIAGYNKEFMLANGVENCNLILGTGSKDKDVERFDGIFQKTLNGTMKNDCKKELGVNLQNPRSTVFTSKDWDG